MPVVHSQAVRLTETQDFSAEQMRLKHLKSRLPSLNRNQKMPKTEVLKFLVNIRRLRLNFSVQEQIFQIFDKTL
jgi:hypothetical protein